MDKKKNKINTYLIFGCILLVILYSFSFFKKPTVDTRKSLKTALVNPKYKTEIDCIVIKNNDDSITLKKNNSFWEISSLENPFIKLPADSQKINTFLEKLTSIIDVYKIADKKNNEENYNLDKNAYDFNFYVQNELSGRILFGKQDFSQTKRYVTSESNKHIFEMEDNIQNFLSVKVNSWSEPFIISQQVLNSIKKDDVQRIIINNSEKYTKTSENWDEYVLKLLDLRQGGIVSEEINFDSLEYQLKLELGNKNEITIYALKTQNKEEFVLKNVYFDFSTNTNFEYYSLISGWTFSKLKYE